MSGDFQGMDWKDLSWRRKAASERLITRFLKAYTDMGVIAMAELNLEEMGERDQAVAEEFDAQRSQRDAAAAAK